MWGTASRNLEAAASDGSRKGNGGPQRPHEGNRVPDEYRRHRQVLHRKCQGTELTLQKRPSTQHSEPTLRQKRQRGGLLWPHRRLHTDRFQQTKPWFLASLAPLALILMWQYRLEPWSCSFRPGVSNLFSRGAHISLEVTFKGLDVILGLRKRNYSLTRGEALGAAAGRELSAEPDERGGGPDWARGPCVCHLGLQALSELVR